MDITPIKLSVLVIAVLYKIPGDVGQGVSDDGIQHGDRCEDIGYRIRNCTKSPNYSLVDNMPIVLNATEIKQFCLNKDSTLACIKRHLVVCKDYLFGVSSIIYDMTIYNTTYNTLCDNMELMWWSETSCIQQLDSRLRNCRWKKEHILSEVQRTGLSAIYCRSLEELYECNTYEVDSTCKKTYSDFLTRYYRGMLTSSVCDDMIPRNQQIPYKSSGDEITTIADDVSSGVICEQSNFFFLSCLVICVLISSFEYSFKIACFPM